MRVNLTLRSLLVAVAVVIIIALLALLVSASNAAFTLLERLQDAPGWMAALYLLLMSLFAVASAIVLWRLLRPSAKAPQRQRPRDEAGLREALGREAQAGVDVRAAELELRELQRRRDSGELQLAVFGEVSTGKSSLIRALMPEAQVVSDVLGGSTQNVTRYHWQLPSGDTLTMLDLPGFNQADGKPELSEQLRDEALRAHLVLYLVDGDLTRSHWAELEQLAGFHKPMVLALNKIDRYSAAQREQLTAQLRRRLNAERLPVVTVQTGGTETVTLRQADGSETEVQRPRKPQLDNLVSTLQAELDRHGEVLHQLRDSAVFLRAAGKLEAAVDAHRHKQAMQLVDTYARRAVLGALAAITPGTDLVIQGALGTKLARELCALYEVPSSAVDIESLIKGVQSRVIKVTALVFAVVGNALKAFPGAGTLGGGLLHAVAFGLIFDSLGKALVHVLETRGELRAAPAANKFEEYLSEDVGARARSFAKLAWEAGRAAKR